MHGIPLGNLTSQLFINIYLHELDFFIKEELSVKKYVRYADDFILVLKSQEESIKLAGILRNFLDEELKLSFPATHEHIVNLSMGIETLGQKFLPFYHKARTDTFNRSRRTFETRCAEFSHGKISVNDLNASWHSLKGMLKYGHNTNSIASLLNLENFYV